MDKNKIILIALIVVIIAFLVGIFAAMPNMNKQNTNLTIISNDTLNEGDSIEIKLTDADGNLLVNQTVNVTIKDNNNASSSYSVVTNESGFGALKLDKIAGEYNVTISYGGNDKYNGCSATQKITIKDEVKQTVSESSTSSSSSSNSGSSSSSSNVDSGAFYSAQAEKVIHTGDVYETPGGKMRHLGNDKWEPVD